MAKKRVKKEELHNIRNVEVARLELDPENPRLPEELKRTQEAMLEHIARTTNITELMEVIGENGYFPGEALVVYPSPNKPNMLRVIEGNRRLTAVKLLLNSGLLKKKGKAHEIARQARYKQQTLPVVEFETREEVLQYLGYRHITGVEEWDPLAKARYLEQLFRRHKTGSGKEKLRAVAREIGSTTTFVRRALRGLYAFHAMEKRDFFGIEGLAETTVDFGVLSTALGYDEIAKHVNRGRSAQDLSKKFDTKTLKELSTWLFDKSNGKTVLGESRNIKKLAKIVTRPAALRTLRSSGSIELAYQETAGVQEDFERLVFDAKSNLQQANALVAQVTSTAPIRREVGDIYRQAGALKKAVDDTED